MLTSSWGGYDFNQTGNFFHILNSPRRKLTKCILLKLTSLLKRCHFPIQMISKHWLPNTVINVPDNTHNQKLKIIMIKSCCIFPSCFNSSMGIKMGTNLLQEKQNNKKKTKKKNNKKQTTPLRARSWDYGICHIGDERRLRWACTFAQSCQSLHCSHTWSMEVDEGSDQKSAI